MIHIDDIPGVHYTQTMLPAVTADAATAYQAAVANPFPNKAAYIDSVRFIPAEAYTGHNTDSFNLNLDLADGTEIANLDYPAAVNAVKGVDQSFTVSGTAAQRLIAANDAVYLEREDRGGTSQAWVVGNILIIGWVPRS